MNQDDDTDQVIGEGESEGEIKDTTDSTVSSDIEQDDLGHLQEVLRLRQAC